jgi:hypothetical protein
MPGRETPGRGVECIHHRQVPGYRRAEGADWRRRGGRGHGCGHWPDLRYLAGRPGRRRTPGEKYNGDHADEARGR